MAPAVLGIDFGTESCRAGVFDPATGAALGFCSEPYPTTFPAPSRAEQSPQAWWCALGNAVRGAVAIAASSLPPDGAGAGAADPLTIAALCIDTTCCTVVAFDRSHPQRQPLRPAIMWCDMRAAEQAARVLATGDAACQVNGGGKGPVSAEWFLPKALWIKENEPEVWQHEHCGVCEFQDWIGLRLTGEYAASRNNVGVRWHFGDGAAPLSLLGKLGLEDLRQRWPAEKVLALGARMGQGLTAEAAEHLGLPVGTAVAQGGADAFIGMLGLGVVGAGDMAMLTGSSHLHLGLSDKPLHAPGMFGSYDGALLPGLHVVEGGQTSTGSAVAWLRGRVLNAGSQAAAAAETEVAAGAADEEVKEGDEKRGKKTAPAAPAAAPSSNAAAAGLSYAQLDALAAALPPGSEGVMALDHFQGNRTPHTDPFSRGCIAGLTLATGPGHLHRALLEGVCFGTEAVLEAMRAAGFQPAGLSVAGGATRSPLWLQMHADVCGLPLSVPAGASDAPALGCAILAAAAAGFHGGDIVRSARAMVRVDRVLKPVPERAREYAPAYARWKTLYPALKATFHQGSGAGAGAAAGGGGSEDAAAASIGALPLVAAALENRVAVAPSLLAANFANPAADLARLEVGWPTDGGGGGKDEEDTPAAAAAAPSSSSPSPPPSWSTRRWLHFDMFDGSLNTQITFGCPLLERLRPLTRRLVDVHLIARDPKAHFEQLQKAGADAVTVQYENVVAAVGPEEGDGGTGAGAGAGGGDGLSRLREVCAEATRVFGSAGVALALGTPAEALAPLLLRPPPPPEGGGGAPLIARALVMAVPLGFGGLKFQRDETLAKIRALRKMGGDRLVIVVDGGIGPEEAFACAEAGANVCVAGSSVFRAKGGVSPGDAERAVLRAAAEGAAARRLQRQQEAAAVVA